MLKSDAWHQNSSNQPVLRSKRLESRTQDTRVVVLVLTLGVDHGSPCLQTTVEAHFDTPRHQIGRSNEPVSNIDERALPHITRIYE